MDITEYIELLTTLPSSELVLTLSFLMFLYFTMYGVFGNDPPIFKKKSLDDTARRMSRKYGIGALVIFLLTVLLPVAHQFIFPSVDFFVNDRKIEISDVSAILLDRRGEVIDGKVEVRIGRWHDTITIPNPNSEQYGVYKGRLRLIGIYDRKWQRIDGVREIGPLQIAGKSKKVMGPLRLVDDREETIFSLEVNNDGKVIFPEAGKVEIMNTQIHYHREDGETAWLYVGSELDLEKYSAGSFDSLFRDHLTPSNFKCVYMSDDFRGSITSSGVSYNPDRLVATSAYFPAGTVLEIVNPILDIGAVSVEVVGSHPSKRCALSRAVFEQLGRSAGSMDLSVRVIDYKHKLPRQNNVNDLS